MPWQLPHLLRHGATLNSAGCQTAEEPTGRQCPAEELTWEEHVYARLYLLTIHIPWRFKLIESTMLEAQNHNWLCMCVYAMRAGQTSPTRRRRPFAKAWSEADESNRYKEHQTTILKEKQTPQKILRCVSCLPTLVLIHLAGRRYWLPFAFCSRRSSALRALIALIFSASWQ
jgi:hypothetical protein